MATDMLLKALQVALYAHGRQCDKRGRLYLRHVLEVVDGVEGETAKVVAALHDVVEDTGVALNELADEFPQEVIEAVDAITRRKGETYKNYIRRAGENELAREVKIADLCANLDSLPDLARRVPYLTWRSLHERYGEAFAYLNDLPNKKEQAV